MIAYNYKYKKSVNPMEILENKAVEPSLKDSTDYLVALMVLKQIEADNELDPLLRSMKSRLDKAGVGANPYHLLNTVFSQEAVVESKAAYAEIWDAIYKEIEQANIKATLPHVGYSQTEIDSIPDDVIQHFNTVSVFEEKFPDDGSKNFPLAERLKAGKDMLFDALTSDKGKAALNAASWGISLATGGIVTRLAIKGGAALASRLIANESVQSFAGRVQGSVTNFLQRTGVPTGALAGHLRDFKENAKAVIASPVFQRYGKPSLALAGLAFGAILLGNVNHDKIVELASNGLSKGAELASAGADAALSGVSSAPGFVGDVATAAAGTVYTGVVEGGNLLVDGVSAAYNDPIGTLNKIASGTADSVKAAGGYVANAASDALDVVSQAPGAIADVAKSGFETVTVEAANAANIARTFVADGLYSAGDFVSVDDVTADQIMSSKMALADSAPSSAPVHIGSKAGFFVDLASGAITIVESDGVQKVISIATDAGKKILEDLSDLMPSFGDSDQEIVATPSEPLDPDDAIGEKSEMARRLGDDSVNSPSAPYDENYEIKEGDSLWKISKEHFLANGIQPTNLQIHEATISLYEINKELIGSNPDLILTGSSLRIDESIFTAKPSAQENLKALNEMLGNNAGFAIETKDAIDQQSTSTVTTPQSAASQAKFDADLSKINELLSGSPDHKSSFSAAVKKLATRDVSDESSLGM